MTRAYVRAVTDVTACLLIYELIEAGILEQEKPNHQLLQDVLKRQTLNLSKEFTVVNQQLDQRMKVLMTVHTIDKPKSSISQRDWAECVEKLMNSDMEAPLQSIAESHRFPLEPKLPFDAKTVIKSVRIPKLETYSVDEAKELLTFQIERVKKSKPVLTLLDILAQGAEKHEGIQRKFLRILDDVDEMSEIAHLERLTPKEAEQHEARKSFAKVFATGIYLLLSSKVFGSPAPPIFTSLLSRGSSQAGSTSFFSRFLTRGSQLLIYRAIFPIVFAVASVPALLFIENSFKQVGFSKLLADWLLEDEEDLEKEFHKDREPRTAAEKDSHHFHTHNSHLEDLSEGEKPRMKEELAAALTSVSRPLRWLGTQGLDPLTPERTMITAILHPLTDSVVFYGLLLRQLLSYINPVTSHFLTAMAYMISRDNLEDGKPDLVAVLSNLSSIEGGFFDFLRSLTYQLLYTATKGSILAPFLADSMRTILSLYQEVLVNLSVYPLEASRVSLLFTVFTNYLGSLLLLSWAGQNLFPKTLTRQVTEAVPQYSEILDKLAADLVQLFSSDHFNDKDLQTLSTSDFTSCVLRLEQYKSQHLQKNHSLKTSNNDFVVATIPIDEYFIADSLHLMSPEFLEFLNRRERKQQEPVSTDLSVGEEKAVRSRSEYLRRLRFAYGYKLFPASLLFYPVISFQENHPLSKLIDQLKREAHAQEGDNPRVAASQRIYMNAVYPIVFSSFEFLLEIDHVPRGRDPKKAVTRKEVRDYLVRYFGTMSPSIAIGELQRIAARQQQSARIAPDVPSTATADLLSFVHYFEDLSTDGEKKKEYLLDLMQEMYSAILQADRDFIVFMEPILFEEFRASLLGRSIGRLQGVPPHIEVLSKEFRNLPGLHQVVLGMKSNLLNQWLAYSHVAREREQLRILYRERLTPAYYQYLVQKYSAHFPEINKLQQQWERFFDPPLPERTETSTADHLKNTYPERLRLLLWKESDPDRGLIYNDYTLVKLSTIKKTTTSSSPSR